MSDPTEIPLESIRTDGWFERIGESIGSFQALCDIIGARFFAFAMITGARITALTVDRRNPDNTLVDFVVGAPDAEVTDADTQRLTLADFRRRLVAALVTEEPIAAPPTRPTDTEAVQLHVGVRYLLLAPLYGYSLTKLSIADGDSFVDLSHDGIDERYGLGELRARIRTHVREELDRIQRGGRSAIDLGRITEAEAAEKRGEPLRVIELLGAWPAPLAIFLQDARGAAPGPRHPGAHRPGPRLPRLGVHRAWGRFKRARRSSVSGCNTRATDPRPPRSTRASASPWSAASATARPSDRSAAR